MKRPIRVLHVTATLDRGGVETWLVNILRVADKRDVIFHFLVNKSREYVFSEDIRNLGGKIFYCGPLSRPFQYARNFFTTLREHGPYDVIHCHTAPFHGFILFLAWIARIPVRIAHSRTAFKGEGSRTWRLQPISRWLIWRFATLAFGVSSDALSAMVGSKHLNDPRFHTLLSGINLTSYPPSKRNMIRNSLDIPDKTMVVGHVGRFSKAKNHTFLVRIAKELTKIMADVKFILVGAGPLLKPMMERVDVLGLSDIFHFLGFREDVLDLLSAMDCFVFPSLWEGLPTALIEAQSIGLPCLVSDNVPHEADAIQSLITRLPLRIGPKAWACEIASILNSSEHLSNEAINLLKDSPYDIRQSYKQLRNYYRRGLRTIFV